MRRLELKRILDSKQDKNLRVPKSRHATVEDYDSANFVGPFEDAEAYKEDGTLLFKVVSQAFDQGMLDRAYERLKTVKGDCTTRPEATGLKNEMRPHTDGSESDQQRAPMSEVEKWREKGCRADILGFYDPKEGSIPYCRQTAWSASDKEKGAPVFNATMPMVRVADRIFKDLVPDRHQFQLYHVSEAVDFTLEGTAFTTITVNRKFSTCYHRDKNDLKGGFGVMFTLGRFTGGQLVFPAFRAAVDYQPGQLILADVHETHGNVDNIVGDRVTCVLYARERIDQCGSAEDEEKKRAATMVIHAGKTTSDLPI
jgi:Oxygenase domain of the 2OGFeDO superfamily